MVSSKMPVPPKESARARRLKKNKDVINEGLNPA